MSFPAFRVFTVVGLTAALFVSTGCAHDRHTAAVLGGIVGAGIGYVIANEADHHDHHRYKQRHGSYGHGHKTHYPPRRDPYCK
ncbi:MAG: hypothetical protein AAF333_16345 [Planctomycetota bacterium]